MKTSFWVRSADIDGIRWDLSFSNERLLLLRQFREVMSLGEDSEVICHDKDVKIPSAISDAWLEVHQVLIKERMQ